MAIKKKRKVLAGSSKKAPKLGKKSSVLKSDPFSPVVTVVGHIDHGKTSLLDKIRESKVATREFGGITQHVGISQILIKDKEGKERKITFIDTPGHAAFTKMRARGVEATDMAILVVAADSGVQEQTKESFAHIKAAKIPFLVAVNKMDLSNVDLEKVKGDLAEIGIIPESYGGEIVVVPVSAKTGKGVDDLLEMVGLVADLQELKDSPQGDTKGVVIEAALDRRRGIVATVIVRSGTIRRGDTIFAEENEAKVKLMTNWLGEKVMAAFPGDPVEILGFGKIPAVGSLISSQPQKPAVEKNKAISDQETELKVIVKADVCGSLEAILGVLPEKVEVIYGGVGEIGDGDVFLAHTTGAQIFGFNVKVSSSAKKVAEQNKVSLFQAEIIYQIFEEIEKRLEKEVDPLSGKQVLGKAEVIAEFKVGGKRIAGARVLEGEILRGQKGIFLRDNKLVGETVLSSLRQIKEDVDKVVEGAEFGAVFSPPIDFALGDVIISYNDEQPDTPARQSVSESD